MTIKRVICPARVRRVPVQFSWVDHRLVQDRHIERCDAHAAALYLFLVTVADAQGLSYYSDASLAQRLSVTLGRLGQARNDLIRAGLIAYERPLYQVLALDPPMPAAVSSSADAMRAAVSSPDDIPASVPSPADDIPARLLLLHAALRRKPS